jgi:hypothetical protein
MRKRRVCGVLWATWLVVPLLGCGGRMEEVAPSEPPGVATPPDNRPAADVERVRIGKGIEATAPAIPPPTFSTCQSGESRPCYDGPPGTQGVGRCRPGTETCRMDGSGFGGCEGQVVPSPTTCFDCVVPTTEHIGLGEESSVDGASSLRFQETDRLVQLHVDSVGMTRVAVRHETIDKYETRAYVRLLQAGAGAPAATQLWLGDGVSPDLRQLSRDGELVAARLNSVYAGQDLWQVTGLIGKRSPGAAGDAWLASVDLGVGRTGDYSCYNGYFGQDIACPMPHASPFSSDPYAGTYGSRAIPGPSGTAYAFGVVGTATKGAVAGRALEAGRAYVVAWDAGGVLRWTWQPHGGDRTMVRDAVVAATGHVYVWVAPADGRTTRPGDSCSGAKGEASSYGVLARLSPHGACEWAIGQASLVEALVPDEKGNVYVADAGRGAITKYDALGLLQWTRTTNGVLLSLLVDGEGPLLLVKEEKADTNHLSRIDPSNGTTSCRSDAMTAYVTTLAPDGAVHLGESVPGPAVASDDPSSASWSVAHRILRYPPSAPRNSRALVAKAAKAAPQSLEYCRFPPCL